MATRLTQRRNASANHADHPNALKVRIAGPAGAGKTSLVAVTAERLATRFQVGAIIANPTARQDAATIAESFDRVAGVDTDCPDAADVSAALDQITGDELDIVLIESGGVAAPYPTVGEDLTAAMFALTGGDDKAAEYRALVRNASIVLLAKTDLRRYVPFDYHAFHGDVRRLNQETSILELSLYDEAALNVWLAWLSSQIDAKRSIAANAAAPSTEVFTSGLHERK